MPRKRVLGAALVGLLSAICAAVSAQTALPARSRESIESRLQRLEDEQEIRTVLLDYGRFLDSRDFGAYSRLFATDGEWVGGLGSVQGPANIQAFMERNIGTGPNRRNNYHLLSNFVITVQGDSAVAWSRWAFIVPGEQGATVAQAGRYDDTRIRQNGQWKFKLRVASNDTAPSAAATAR
jgi:uncharacterized protein (TIGR02246 family)